MCFSHDSLLCFDRYCVITSLSVYIKAITNYISYLLTNEHIIKLCKYKQLKVLVINWKWPKYYNLVSVYAHFIKTWKYSFSYYLFRLMSVVWCYSDLVPQTGLQNFVSRLRILLSIEDRDDAKYLEAVNSRAENPKLCCDDDLKFGCWNRPRFLFQTFRNISFVSTLRFSLKTINSQGWIAAFACANQKNNHLKKSGIET